MTPRRRTILLLGAMSCAAWAAAGPTPVALAQAMAPSAPIIAHQEQGTGAIVLDEQLAPKRVRLLSIEDGVVVAQDEFGRRRTFERGRLSALIIEPPRPSHSGLDAVAVAGRLRRERTDPGVLHGLLVLGDGQRFPGEFLPAPGPERVAWHTRLFGALDVPIDRVRLARTPGLPGPRALPAPGAINALDPAGDTLVLENADRLRGFVARLGDPTAIETDTGIVEVPLQRVALAQLDTPLTPGAGPRVWLADGTVAALIGLSWSVDRPASLRLLDGPAGSIDWSLVRAVVFDTARVRPLSALARTEVTPDASRRFTQPVELRVPADAPEAAEGLVPLDAMDLVLPGPMSLSVELPEGTARLAATARLDAGTGPWGDCELVVSVDGREIARSRLQSGAPPTSLNLPIEGRRLTLQTVPGAYGPILDRVVLERPLLLVSQGGTRP